MYDPVNHRNGDFNGMELQMTEHWMESPISIIGTVTSDLSTTGFTLRTETIPQ